MTTPITPAECRELAERLGLCWPEYGNPNQQFYQGQQCLNKTFIQRPNFHDARVPLRLAMKREDGYVFIKTLHNICMTAMDTRTIPIKLMADQTGQLAKLLLEWLREREGK